MAKRIAVVKKEKCNPVGCGGYLCMKVNPDNRQGIESIYVDVDKKVAINEELCGSGISIAVNKCPFHALAVVNLPESLDKEPIHRYGKNGFALFNLPTPVFGKVVGVLGRNGIGKSTAVKILAGIIKPNLGKTAADDKEVINYFKGTEAQSYFEKLQKKEIKVAYKPQQVDAIPKQFQGTVKQLLEKADEKKELSTIAKLLELTAVLDHDIKNISGGELQRVAIAATVLKKANVYFFDEPTSYLDIKQRLKIAQFIKNLADENTAVMVVEHDLIILDYLADTVHLLYGNEAEYGIVSQPKAAKAGINVYLQGYLKEENVRFREKPISFPSKASHTAQKKELLTSWEDFEEKIGSFTLKANKGVIYKHNCIGILGENGIGKTSFARILAGEIKNHPLKIKISYKSQYLEPSEELVMIVLQRAITHHENSIIRPLNLKPLFERKVNELSGGELQRVAIAYCLSQDADVFLLDEPSAYMDVEQRLNLSKVMQDFLSLTGKSALIIDHDLLFIDYLSDELVVFEGQPAVNGTVHGPFPMEQGMNNFLQDLQITFRRDPETNRPRANKLDSQKDMEQKGTGKLYY
ncbi:ribosome biogenesis/translation initiation ATPase RLI [Candidatus Woesearchaeota archaeon]|nr:MAG: ribosome biogenesis/translation initiation ATPase RLI [Candidatus Woesearchaeota archaeon]